MVRKSLTATATLFFLISQTVFAITPEQALNAAQEYVSRFPVPAGMNSSKTSYDVETYTGSMPESSYVVSFLGSASEASSSNPFGCDSNEFYVIVSQDTGKVIPEIRIPYWGNTRYPFRTTYLGWSCNYENGLGGGT